MKNIILDNIIFSLQEAGGISVYWIELLKRIINDKDFNLKMIEYENNNIFRASLRTQNNRQFLIKNTIIPISLQRYLDVNFNQKSGIFHSSYYRISKSNNLVNISTVHDFTYEYYRTGLSKIIQHRQKGKAIKNSNKIICVSQNTKEDLLKFYPKIKKNQLKVIYNGVDEIYQPIINKDEIKLRKMIQFSSGEFALYVGDRRALYKNFIVAISACKIANSPIVMVGGGPLTNIENKLLTETLGENNFKLLNGISNDQLNLIYNHALCLLYPSLYEGFGIPIVEAQRAGCPVITSNFSSLPEISGKGAVFLNEVTGLRIADLLNQLKRNSAFARNLKEEGFLNSKRFSWDQCYQQTKQVYKEVYEEHF